MKSSTSQIVLSAETISTSKFIPQIVQSIVVHQILPCPNPDLLLLASIALMPKTKEIPKTKKSGNEVDPFDGLERPAMKNMIDMMMWHNRMLPKQLPTFLHEFRVIHFLGAEKKHDADFSVYELYHCLLESHSDRNSLSACISKGETIAIWEKEQPTAISAITFLQRENSVLVLFLATLVEYQNAGMCTFLLSIMQQVVKCRESRDEVNVFLKANPKDNEAAWKYYKGRKFAEMEEDPKAFPKALTDCFANEVDDSPLKDYLGFSKDLKWLTICLTREYFALPSDVHQKGVKARLFYNPTDNTIRAPCLYATLPGNMTYDEVVHCKPNYSQYTEEFWDAKAFHPSTHTQNKESYEGPTARLTWIERCLGRKGDSLSSHLLGLALGWLQRYSKAEIWSTMTIIPTAIMTDVFVMETVFASFIEGRIHIRKLPQAKRTKAENRDLSKHIFHFNIDTKRFMKASVPVVEYILQNKALFAKPFIAMAAQNYKDYSWSAFVAVNCDRNGNKERDPRCGYFLFDPTRTRDPRDPPMQCKFFLKLAYMILKDEKVVALCFTTLQKFYKAFTNQSLNFGCVINDNDNERCDIEDGRFNQLNLPSDYMFSSTTGQATMGQEKLERERSGIKSLIFIHDFGTMVHDVTFDNSGDVKGGITFDDNGVVSGMGRQLPRSKKMFNQLIREVHMSLYQLTDRIASTQMGSVREESEEYVQYLIPDKDTQRRILAGTTVKMPKPDKAFPDLAKHKGWKPALTERPQTQITEGSGESQTNEVESPNNWKRKPRAKGRDKKASGKEQAKSPGRRTKDGEGQEVEGTLTLKQTPDKKKRDAVVEMQRVPIAGVSHSIEFSPCTEHIDECSSTFRNDFQRATSEEMKKNLCWKVLALLHSKSPLPFVDDALKSIRDSLDNGEKNGSVIEQYGDWDVLCGKGSRRCVPYIKRTMEMKNMYSLAKAKGIMETKEVMSTIYMTLKQEGLRFLDERTGGGWEERTSDSAIAYIKKRMTRLSGEKEGDKMEQSALEVAAGPFESAVRPPNGIVLHQRDVPKKGLLSNQILRREIWVRATAATFAKEDDERDKIAAEVMHEMKNKGYTFVYKEDDVWKDMENEQVRKEVKTRLLKARRHWENTKKMTGKRKAGDENATHFVDHSTRTGEDRCIECDNHTNHSCRQCKRSVCSICCQSKRDLEGAWWCKECFENKTCFLQMVIRQGCYSSSEE